jgi:thioredoxin-like negative regulator of GroEL
VSETNSAKPLHAADAAELDAYFDANDTVLVEFYTEGCGVCASMEPVLGTVAKVTDAAVVTVNPRDDPVLVERFEIRSVPTLVLVEEGEEVARLAEGFQGVDAVVEFIESAGRDEGTTD